MNDEMTTTQKIAFTSAVYALQDAAGADGVWLLREAEAAVLHFAVDGSGEQALALARPHDLILLVRFPAGDGGEPGIEYRSIDPR